MGAIHRHDVDFFGWTQEQAAKLRADSCDFSLLDRDYLAEEIEDMGRGEIKEISSLLHQTLAHLFKIAISPKAQSVDHWFNEILTFQGDAVITFSPDLRQLLDLDTIWRVACNGATRSLERYDVTVPPLPKSCPLTLDQLLDHEFDPNQAAATISAAIHSTPHGD